MSSRVTEATTSRRPVTRPLAPWTFVIPVVLAAGIGLALAYDLGLTLVVCGGLLAAGAMLVRLEWAVLIVVAAAVFEDYLVLVSPWATKTVAVLLVGAWVVRRGWRRLHDGPRSPVLVAALAFLAVLLVSAVVHRNGDAGTVVVLRYVGFLAVLAVLIDTMRGGLAPRRVARVYVVSCVVAAGCGIVTYALALDRQVVGPIADPNDFAFHLVAAIPLALALRGGARRAWTYDVAVAVMLVATLGTLSRGALLGLAVMLVLAVLIRVMPLRAAAVWLVAAGTLAALAAGVAPQLVDVSLAQKSAVAEQNVTERLDLWGSASRMTMDSPVLGHGPGSFSLDHEDYRDRLPVDPDHQLDVAHNTYLEVAAELGLLGLAAWLALLASAVLAAWSGWARDRDLLAAGVVIALVGAGTAAVFVTEQYFLPLWLLMALAGALLHPPPSTASMLRSPSA